MDYDPDRAPDPQEWLALDEDERLFAVLAWHRERGEELPNERLHASFHTVVETQLAANDPPDARRTLSRLGRQGLDRHDALHATGSVLAGQMWEAQQDSAPAPDITHAYVRELKKLNAESWLSESD